LATAGVVAIPAVVVELAVAALLKSAAGKILKRDLRARYWSGRHERVAGA
jgi:hypothetical protein